MLNIVSCDMQVVPYNFCIDSDRHRIRVICMVFAHFLFTLYIFLLHVFGCAVVGHSVKGVFITCGTSFCCKPERVPRAFNGLFEVSTSCNCRAAKANRGQRTSCIRMSLGACNHPYLCRLKTVIVWDERLSRFHFCNDFNCLVLEACVCRWRCKWSGGLRACSHELN